MPLTSFPWTWWEEDYWTKKRLCCFVTLFVSSKLESTNGRGIEKKSTVWQDTWFAKMGLSNFDAMERSWDRPSKICSVLYTGRGRNKLFDFIILMCCLINSYLFYSSLIFALLVPFNMFSPSLMCMHLCYFGCKFSCFFLHSLVKTHCIARNKAYHELKTYGGHKT